MLTTMAIKRNAHHLLSEGVTCAASGGAGGTQAPVFAENRSKNLEPIRA